MWLTLHFTQITQSIFLLNVSESARVQQRTTWLRSTRYFLTFSFRLRFIWSITLNHLCIRHRNPSNQQPWVWVQLHSEMQRRRPAHTASDGGGELLLCVCCFCGLFKVQDKALMCGSEGCCSQSGSCVTVGLLLWWHHADVADLCNTWLDGFKWDFIWNSNRVRRQHPLMLSQAGFLSLFFD